MKRILPLARSESDVSLSIFGHCFVLLSLKLTGSSGTGLVAFGKYAGIAGMIDTFQCLGRRLLASGFSTPFLNCSPAYVYYDLDEAKRSVKELGRHIEEDGLPMSLEPLVFAFTGNGNVTTGALQMFQLLPHKMVTLDEAIALKNTTGPHKCIYGLMVQQQDLVKRTGSEEVFDVKHYRENPSEYESTFASKVAPICNVIVNGIYWDERYPRELQFCICVFCVLY